MDFSALFENFTDSQLPFPCLELFLKITNAYQSLSENCKSVVTYLDKTLKKAKGCDIRGLFILKTVVNQCSPDLFVDNCINWAEKLLKIIQTHENENIVKLAYEITLDILPYVPQNSELNRQFINLIVPKLLTAIIKSKEKTNVSQLKCLRELMKLFRGPCRQVNVEIEKFILKELFENENSFVQHEATRCLVLIPSLGAAELTSNVTEAWEDFIQKILGSLHVVLVNLLDPVLKQDSIVIKYDGFEMPQLQEASPVVQLQKLQQRFHALCHCLCEILRTPFQSIVHICFEDIIGLISQIITVTPQTFDDQITLEVMMLASILPFMHEDALMILQAVIETGRRYLMPYTNAICKMLFVGFEWTFQNTAETSNAKPLSGLRRQLYSTIQIWVQTMTSSSGLEQHAEQLILHIINDLKNPAKKIQLQTSTDEKNRRKRKRGQTYAAIGVIGASKDNPLNNDHLCISALSALKAIHYVMGTTLKPTVYQEICSAVIHVILEIQKNERNRPAPYDNADCRKELFSALLSLVLISPRGAGSPLQVAIGLFSTGSLDSNRKVSSICLEAKATCMQLIHPRFPSLQLNLEPVENDNVQRQTLQPKKKSALFPVEKHTKVADSAKVDENSTNGEPLEKVSIQEQTPQPKKKLAPCQKEKPKKVKENRILKEHQKLEKETPSKNQSINEVIETIDIDVVEEPQKVKPTKINEPTEIETINRNDSFSSDVSVQDLTIPLSPENVSTACVMQDDRVDSPNKLESSNLQPTISPAKSIEKDSNVEDIEILSPSPTTSPPKKRKLTLDIPSSPTTCMNTSADIKLVMSPLTPTKAASQDEVQSENQLTVEEMLQDFVSEEPNH